MLERQVPCCERCAVHAAKYRARTNFNILELLAALPDGARTILDAAAEGRRERAHGRASVSGAISQARGPFRHCFVCCFASSPCRMSAQSAVEALSA